MASACLVDEETASPAAAGARVSARIGYMDDLRAVATLLVIASHCYGLAWSGAPGGWFVHAPLLNLISGATPLFVFISGFFVHHALAPRLGLSGLLRKRAVAVLPAYFVTTAGLLLIERAMGVDGWRYIVRHDYATQFALSAVAGGGGPAMWFIPFLFAMLLFSPLFLLLPRLRVEAQAILLAALFALGLWVDRDALNILDNVVHFGAIFALGIVFSAHRTWFEQWMARPGTILAAGAIVILASIAQYRFGLAEAAHQPLPWAPVKFVYVQKTALIALLLGLFMRGWLTVPGMKRLVDHSPGLFFAHQYWVLLLAPVAGLGLLPPGIGALAFYAALVLALSMATILACRRLFGRGSHHLIGA